ncbi:MAG: radical SAM protein [Candidatus Nanoarchaeia archaeon]
MNKFPEVITFRITSRCNNNCKYCYGPNKKLKEMDFPKLKEMFKLFHKNGVKAVVLTGGEPLVRDDFEKIIKELKSYNFKIFLDTSGDLFFNHSDLILKNVHFIGLPMDFADKSYRNAKHFNTVIRILKYFKQHSKRPIIRIGTVVTRDNFQEIERIGNVIKDYSVDMWKIYEFIPQNENAIKNKSSLEVSSADFNEKTKKLKNEFSNNFQVIISKRKDRTNAYFFVGSDGIVFMPVDDLGICKEVRIGNIFDSDIDEKWKKMVLKNNYVKMKNEHLTI